MIIVSPSTSSLSKQLAWPTIHLLSLPLSSPLPARFHKLFFTYHLNLSHVFMGPIYIINAKSFAFMRYLISFWRPTLSVPAFLPGRFVMVEHHLPLFVFNLNFCVKVEFGAAPLEMCGVSNKFPFQAAHAP